ncbi:MAG: hypothetical protein RIR49_436 [Actinomycetota bacterium]|jgi:hypothetical protein
MAWQPRRHWDWLVAENDLAPTEDEYRTIATCDICGAWIVRRVDGLPESIRINADDDERRPGVTVTAADPDRALLLWSLDGGGIDVRCRCGWPHHLVAPPRW